MERSRVRFSLAVSGPLVLVLALVGACGGDGGDSPVDAGARDAGSISAEGFARESARLQCEIALRCESRFAFGAALSQAGCHPGNRYYDAQIMAVAAGRAEFDAEAAAACLEGLAGVTCFEGTSNEVSECGRVFTGTVALGGACTTPTLYTLRSLECAAGASCSVGATCPGACVAPPARGGNGDACDPTMACDADHVCRDGVCVARRGAGAECASHYDCQSGLFCGPGAGATNACLDPSAIVAPGGPCLLTPLSDSCPAELVCVCDDCDLAGTCVTPVAIGARCEATAPCGHSARCVDGTCRPIAMPKGDCSTGAVCPLTHACDGSICRALPALGDGCVDSCFQSACLVDGDVCGFAGAGIVEAAECRLGGPRCAEGLECRQSDDVTYRCDVRC